MDNGLTLELAEALDKEIKQQFKYSGGVNTVPVETVHRNINKLNDLMYEAEFQAQDKDAVKVNALQIAAHACRLLQELWP